VAAALPVGPEWGAARTIPLVFHHAPTPRQPKKNTPPEQWQTYETERKKAFRRDRWYVLVVRDTHFPTFRDLIEGSETKNVLLPPPRLNVYANLERYLRPVKSG